MQTKSLLPPEKIEKAADKVKKVLDELNKILLGRPHLHKLVLVGILSKGHILLEGLPGLAKQH